MDEYGERCESVPAQLRSARENNDFTLGVESQRSHFPDFAAHRDCSAVEAAPAARRGPRAEHCTRFCPAKGLARLFTNLCDQDHRPAAMFCAILRESFVGERMEKPSLLTAVGKLAIAGEQAGFSIEQMIELLNEGLSVETLLDLISWRLQTIHEEATAPPACSSGWIVSKCQQLSN